MSTIFIDGNLFYWFIGLPSELLEEGRRIEAQKVQVVPEYTLAQASLAPKPMLIPLAYTCFFLVLRHKYVEIGYNNST